MSLPIVIIFERHWDIIPKSVMQDLLPDLSKKGYKTFCLEAPQNLSFAEIIERHNLGLAFDSKLQDQAENLLKRLGITNKLSDISFESLSYLLKLYVSSKKYETVAEKIKLLPSSYLLKDIFNEAQKLCISIQGIDIDSKDFDEMTSIDLTKRMSGIRLRENLRITTIVQNLLKLRAQQEEGIFFACGATHAKGLISALKKQGLENEILYYFPHSSAFYDKSMDDIKLLIDNSSDVLVDHTHLLAHRDIKPFSQRMIQEITEKTKYTREILDYNSHTQFLSDFFKTTFRAFLRPGYHVDALVDVTEPFDSTDIQRRVSEANIQTHFIALNGRKYLAIANVNTPDIAKKIHLLSSSTKK